MLEQITIVFAGAAANGTGEAANDRGSAGGGVSEPRGGPGAARLAVRSFGDAGIAARDTIGDARDSCGDDGRTLVVSIRFITELAIRNKIYFTKTRH